MSNITTSQTLPSANVVIVFIVLKCLIFIVRILGNACVIIYNVLLNHSKTPTSYLLVNVAINDFLTCCLIYPFWITIFTRSALGITSDQKLLSLVRQICEIGVMKFVFINWPLNYDFIVRRRRTYFALLIIWAFGIILKPFIVYSSKQKAESTGYVVIIPCCMFLPFLFT